MFGATVGWALQPSTADGGVTWSSDGVSVAAHGLSSVASFAAPCEGNNFATDAHLDHISMGGPLIALSWEPLNSVTVHRIEVFTGEQQEWNALAIWSDDGGSTSRPLAPLGYTDDFMLDLEKGWQGAALNTPVSVTAGTKYWVVWDPGGGEQAAVSDNPLDIQQTYWVGYLGTVQGDTSWDLGPFSFPDRRWKFRMFCAPPDPVDQLDVLVETIEQLGLRPGTANSLTAKLDTAKMKLEDSNPNNDVATVNTLNAFIHHVEAQRGKKVSEADADDLLDAVRGIIQLLES